MMTKDKDLFTEEIFKTIIRTITSKESNIRLGKF